MEVTIFESYRKVEWQSFTLCNQSARKDVYFKWSVIEEEFMKRGRTVVKDDGIKGKGSLIR